nr:RNA-binding protein with serine-rich domain 1-like [Onthophagus taurus]
MAPMWDWIKPTVTRSSNKSRSSSSRTPSSSDGSERESWSKSSSRTRSRSDIRSTRSSSSSMSNCKSTLKQNRRSRRSSTGSESRTPTPEQKSNTGRKRVRLPWTVRIEDFNEKMTKSEIRQIFERYGVVICVKKCNVHDDQYDVDVVYKYRRDAELVVNIIKYGCCITGLKNLRARLIRPESRRRLRD